MFYYDLAPLVRTSLASKQVFTYRSLQKIPMGSLVEIFFAKYKQRGVVLSRVGKPAFATKPIHAVLQRSLLDKKQLVLARALAKEYYTSLGVVLKFFVPKIALAKTELPQKSEIKTRRHQLTAHQKSAAARINSSNRGVFLLKGPAACGKTEVIFRIVEQCARKNRQSLVLIPELLLSQQEIARYQKFFPQQRIALYHSHCTPAQARGIYQGTKTGSIKIVLATRMGLFLPFKDLAQIVVDEEQDSSYKQWDQMPHYHARWVARSLAKLHQCKVVYSSATPSLEMLLDVARKKARQISLPRLKTGQFEIKKPNIELVDLAKYHSKSKPFAFSGPLKQAVDKVLDKGQMVAFLVPRRGMGTRVLCTDCKKIQSCPNCELPLVHSKDKYRCLHCNFSASLFSSCQQCKSYRLVDIGFGTEKVSDFLKTVYSKSKIVTIDAWEQDKVAAKKKAIGKISNNEVDFIVGTSAVAKGLDFPQIGCAAVLNADAWAGKIEFRHDERWARDLMQFAGRLNRPLSDQQGLCIIQTYQGSENYKFLSSWNWDLFAKDELASRKAAKYPPYHRIIKLTCRGTNSATIDKKANMVYNQLLEAKNGSSLAVSNPYFGMNNKTRGIYRKNILLNYKTKLPRKIGFYLGKLDSAWTIDVDPEFIF